MVNIFSAVQAVRVQENRKGEAGKLEEEGVERKTAAAEAGQSSGDTVIKPSWVIAVVFWGLLQLQVYIFLHWSANEGGHNRAVDNIGAGRGLHPPLFLCPLVTSPFLLLSTPAIPSPVAVPPTHSRSSRILQLSSRARPQGILPRY